MNIEKLQSISAKYEELTKAISDPAIIADNKEWTKLVKEHSQLEPVVDAFKRYESTKKEIADLIEMIEIEEDKAKSVKYPLYN